MKSTWPSHKYLKVGSRPSKISLEFCAELEKQLWLKWNEKKAQEYEPCSKTAIFACVKMGSIPSGTPLDTDFA